MDDLCVFTTGADHLLIDSGKRVGIEVHNYECAPWPGYVTGKLKRGVEFLQTRGERYAMWVDGRDSLILKPAAEILKRRPLGVLISSEHNCWPNPEAEWYYTNESRQYQVYINAGGFVGSRSNLIWTMQRVLDCADSEDDQRAWTTAYIRGEIDMRIDGLRYVFCSEGDGDTQASDPCVRHWNGRVPGREEFWKALTR